MSDAEKHIRTLRLRMKLLEKGLIPQARKDNHHALRIFEDEWAALEWVLRHWDASRSKAPS